MFVRACHVRASDTVSSVEESADKVIVTHIAAALMPVASWSTTTPASPQSPVIPAATTACELLTF